MTLGARIAQGREAEVYAWDSADDVVVKLYRPGFGGHVSEAAALAGLDGIGVAPRLVGTVQVDGRVGLLLQRLDGVDMLKILEHRPWQLVGLAHKLARSAIRIHQVQAPPVLPDLIDVLGERIATADLHPKLRD